MPVNNGPFTTYTDATRVDEELSHTLVTYGDAYPKLVGSFYVTYRVKTTTTAYRYRLCFMTKSAAESAYRKLVAEHLEQVT
jgi:hypothetical protein